jgi:acyl-CoA hydrolase
VVLQQMSWTNQYNQKLQTADEALSLVRSGDRVWVHEGCATPQPLIEALVRRAPELFNVDVTHMLTFGDAPYVRPEYEGHFRHRGLFIGANVREAVQQGRADYTPIFLSEIEGLFTSGQLPLDGALIQTSTPDPHGYVSLGAGIDCTLTAVRCARYVIAEVNAQMPRSHGDAFVHISELTAIVETNRPLVEVPSEEPTGIQRRIAEHVASLIPDGATIQSGIGGIPNAVLHCLRNHRDLGVHSEMCPDGIVSLVESGVINGRRKTLHNGKIVAGFVLGTKRIFDFMHDNPVFEMRPTAYVNDPFVIAQNEHMIAVNSAIQVDLTGQVSSDCIGHRPYSGFGGQVDFVRGAARSKGGKPIIALPATAKDGHISRIVATLDPGAGVVTSRADVHYVVTEHGIAYLHGKSLRERTEALIAIADPRFRADLEREAERLHYLQPARQLMTA